MAYQTKVVIDILSDDPIEGHVSVANIAYEIMHGSWSGHTEISKSQKLSREKLVEACGEHGTDPTFFTGWEDELEENE